MDLEAVANSITDGADAPRFEDAATSLAWDWGSVDPEGAMGWANELPEEFTDAVVSSAARGWAEHDAFGLSEYLIEAPEGTLRDAATLALVEAIQASEPDSAWEWAARIGDAEGRRQSQREVLTSWLEFDRGRALEAAESVGMSATEIEQLEESR
jgi:hypothetical protein